MAVGKNLTVPSVDRFGESCGGMAATTTRMGSYVKSAWDAAATSAMTENPLLAGGAAPDTLQDALRIRPAEQYQAVEERTLRQRIWALVDDPSSSTVAQALAISIMALIVLTGVAFILETVPGEASIDPNVWNTIETICVVCFTIELAVRLLSCPDYGAYIREPMNWVDIIAIAPWYVETFVTSSGASSSSVFRIIRLVRIFRVFKISRYITWISVFSNAIRVSAHPLAMLLYIMALALVLFSTAMYYAERGTLNAVTNIWERPDGSPSPYYSIPATFWWCIITITTVGYGDVVPITGTGRFIAGLAALCGILVLAIPITIISANFNSELDRMVHLKDIDVTTLATLRDALERAYFNRQRCEVRPGSGMLLFTER